MPFSRQIVANVPGPIPRAAAASLFVAYILAARRTESSDLDGIIGEMYVAGATGSIYQLAVKQMANRAQIRAAVAIGNRSERNGGGDL